MCHVTYLPMSPQGRPRFLLSYRGNLQQPIEFKIMHTKKLLPDKTPSRTCPIDDQAWVVDLRIHTQTLEARSVMCEIASSEQTTALVFHEQNMFGHEMITCYCSMTCVRRRLLK